MTRTPRAGPMSPPQQINFADSKSGAGNAALSPAATQIANAFENLYSQSPAPKVLSSFQALANNFMRSPVGGTSLFRKDFSRGSSPSSTNNAKSPSTDTDTFKQPTVKPTKKQSPHGRIAPRRVNSTKPAAIQDRREDIVPNVSTQSDVPQIPKRRGRPKKRAVGTTKRGAHAQKSPLGVTSSDEKDEPQRRSVGGKRKAPGRPRKVTKRAARTAEDSPKSRKPSTENTVQAQSKKAKSSVKRGRTKRQKFSCPACNRTFGIVQGLSAHKRFCKEYLVSNTANSDATASLKAKKQATQRRARSDRTQRHDKKPTTSPKRNVAKVKRPKKSPPRARARVTQMRSSPPRAVMRRQAPITPSPDTGSENGCRRSSRRRHAPNPHWWTAAGSAFYDKHGNPIVRTLGSPNTLGEFVSPLRKRTRKLFVEEPASTTAVLNDTTKDPPARRPRGLPHRKSTKSHKCRHCGQSCAEHIGRWIVRDRSGDLVHKPSATVGSDRKLGFVCASCGVQKPHL